VARPRSRGGRAAPGRSSWGTVVIAWHGGTTPSRIARSLRLPEEALGRIERALRIHFSDVTRHQLAGLDVFTAVRSR
jgi:hypothetical protein